MYFKVNYDFQPPAYWISLSDTYFLVQILQLVFFALLIVYLNHGYAPSDFQTTSSSLQNASWSSPKVKYTNFLVSVLLRSNMLIQLWEALFALETSELSCFAQLALPRSEESSSCFALATHICAQIFSDSLLVCCFFNYSCLQQEKYCVISYCNRNMH